MEPGSLAGALAALVLLGSTEVSAAPTKLRQGFASMVITDGVSLIPRNAVTRARGGDDVIFWIQWQDPVPLSTLRCVVKGPGTDIDETENFAEAKGKGFSICGMESEASDDGTFHFTQYLDGQMVGEQSITIDKEPFFSSRRKKWKWIAGGVGFFILGVYWIRRRATGDTRSLKQVMGGESQATVAVRDAIAIGSHRDGGTQSMAAGKVAPPKTDEAPDLRKLGMQFEMSMAQADKSKGLELGRRYLGLLLKERNESEAVKVFKACVAEDPAFRPAQAEEVLPIAKAARAAGDPQAAVAVLRGFDKSYPGHGLIPDIYMFSAKLMAEDLRNTEMARKILQHILDKYPGHYIAQEAKRYLQSMPKSA